MIEVSAIELGVEEERLVLEVLRSGRLAQGPMVARFEEAFRETTGTRHAVAVSSGTTALVACLQALDLGPGDEVVTSPFTFVATLNAILEAGATARFADIGDDFTVDPAAVDAEIGARTKVVMPVHLYGLPADMTAIARSAATAGAAIVEDAAQAHAAIVDDRPVGAWGLGCFSFYATKNVTTGEGGVVTTDDDGLADRLRLLRGQGMRERYQYEIAGHNYRMTDLQAAIGIPQVARIDVLTARRQANAAQLTEGLSGIDGLRTPLVPAGRTHVFHQYTIEVDPDLIPRDLLAERLLERGVRTGVYYPRVVFDYECYLADPRVVVSDVPRARAAAARVLSLPVHPGVAEAQLDEIVTAVREAVGA